MACVLKECAEALDKPLEMWCGRSLDEATVLREWKKAGVKHFSKKGDGEIAHSCKPVLVTNVVSKFIEKILRRETDVLWNYNLFEYGFKVKRSCITNPLDSAIVLKRE